MKACLHDLSERWEGPSEARSPDCQSLPTANEGCVKIIWTGDADDAVGGAEGIEEAIVGSAHRDETTKGPVDDQGIP